MTKLPNIIAATVPKEVVGSVFHILMVYEDSLAGKRAMDACQVLMSQLEGEVELRSSMWTFHTLRNPKLSRIATEDAIEADVIIIATGRNSELPGDVRKWIELWVPQKQGQTAALVAMTDFTGGDSARSSVTHVFLKGAAATAGIDFLSQEFPQAENQKLPVPESSFEARSWMTPDSVISRPAPEGWGLND
jgi:hypothetical protein